MSYISHTDYTKMLSAFGKETPKGLLKETLEKEGNAFTAGLAKTEKGGEFKVDGKAVKDTSGYDAPVGEEREVDPIDKWYRDFEKGLKNLVNNEYISKWWYDYYMKALDHIDPMEDYGTMSGNDAAKAFIDDQRTKDQMDADKEQWSKEVGEGLNMPPLQATGQTIVTKEDQAPYGFSVLSPDERKQLKEFIESLKTIKGEIAKLLEKAGKSGKIMEDKRQDDEDVPAERPAHYNDPTKKGKAGGNRTNLIMTKAEMWENESPEEIESKLSPEMHDKVHKTLDALKAALAKEGLEGWEIEMFIKHEIEEKGKEAIMGQHDF